MKSELSRFYAAHKSAIKNIIAFLLVVAVPLFASIYGLAIYGVYLSINLIAVLPALTFSQAVLLAMPFAVIKFIYALKRLETVKFKRRLLEYSLRTFQNQG